ncbi:EAL domain-containing protein [uncultured Photobacterium sp.]|uniref:bifunctional diguanylate cyclase/phosphodiesterase n=1 Tax=uncultured Photobacterium sp. TaxID=173973 RepID=UPI0026315C05|nr:EAL domain-containing protein [uncultured Photobacterium sp.]
MTLYRQLTTWLLALFTLLVLAVSVIHFMSRQSQLQQHYRHQSNSNLLIAEVAIRPHLTTFNQQNITPLLEELMARQNWKAIKLTKLTSGQTFKKQNQTQIEGVPMWFTKLGLFEQRTITCRLDVQHSSVAELSITTRPVEAYQQLWQSTLSFLSLAFITLLIGCIGSLYLLKHSLKPLTYIVRRAKEISNNQFGHPIPLPVAKDLKAIVKLINHLTSQLDINFKAQAKEAVKLREQAYRDPVSKLGNRNFFINQLNSWLTNSCAGGMALLKASLIDDCYRHLGFQEGDKLVKELAEQLNEVIIHSDVSLARLSFDEFALLVPNISEEKLKLVGESMLSVIDHTHKTYLPKQHLNYQVGLVMNSQPSSSSTLLTQLDNALSQAALTPQSPIALIDDKAPHTTLGKQQWKTLLQDAIDNDYFIYQYQPVSLKTNSIYQYEVFTSIKKNNDLYTASQFLGAIEDLEVGSLFDRHVIAQLVNRLNANPQLGPLAINITNSSIYDPAFIRWLSQIMEKNQPLSSRLFFELPEASFIRHPDSTGLLCSAIRFYKFKFGVDHYGRHFKSLDYLKEFRPDYVKIDFVYTHQLNDQTKSSVLSSISRTAHSLNILTIATRVETETQLERLSELFVSGFQGFIIESQYKRQQQNYQPSAIAEH